MCSEMRIAKLAYSQSPGMPACQTIRRPRYSVCDALTKRHTTVDDAKVQPTGKLGRHTHSVSFAAALAHKAVSSRHSAISADLYSYHGYKKWTAKIRNAFDEAK
jgi:hypothetical protein